MKIFFLFFVICSVKAQNSFVLQYLGDSLSIEEATNRELCESKYCLADAKYLFYGATQNKSVRPCDDFEEFALGTFLKYETVSDRNLAGGFRLENLINYYHKLRRALVEPAKVTDSRISKGMKTFFAKCVNSKYINKNGVREAREYARSFGLKFYPETNDKDFDLKNYIEQYGDSIADLFFIYLGYFDDDRPTDLLLRFEDDKIEWLEKQLESYETRLYDMNQIYRNSSYSEEFKKEFKEIKDKQIEFFQRLKNVFLSVKEENSTKLMTIEELNNLTLPLNLNWLTIINNRLFTKVNSTKTIFVSKPQSILKIAEFLAETKKEIIADYLVVLFLARLNGGILVYDEAVYTLPGRLTTRSPERWYQCVRYSLRYLSLPLDALFRKRYIDKETEDSLRQLVNKTIEFVLEKLKFDNREEVLEDISKRLKSMKVITGFSEEVVSPDLLEELYGSLDFNQSYIKILHEVYLLFRKLKSEQKTIKLLELAESKIFFKYRFSDNILFIDSIFLNYPFYHKDRPRFFNAVTVSNQIFQSLAVPLTKYLKDKYNIEFGIFRRYWLIGYHFYDTWLKSGGKELNLGANRLTNQQLYWIAFARTHFFKYNSVNSNPGLGDQFRQIHEIPEFQKAFDCKVVKQKK